MRRDIIRITADERQAGGASLIRRWVAVATMPSPPPTDRRDLDVVGEPMIGRTGPFSQSIFRSTMYAQT